MFELPEPLRVSEKKKVRGQNQKNNKINCIMSKREETGDTKNKGQVSDKTSALDAGADDYVVKPFSFEELFSRIRALVRRANRQGDPILRVSDLQLDPKAMKVVRARKIINLSAKEFAVLEYLMRNKNKVISKDKIVSHVWNYQADVLPSTVEVHMKHLRDKIDAPFKQQLIKTVRGFGYEICS